MAGYAVCCYHTDDGRPDGPVGGSSGQGKRPFESWSAAASARANTPPRAKQSGAGVPPPVTQTVTPHRQQRSPEECDDSR